MDTTRRYGAWHIPQCDWQLVSNSKARTRPHVWWRVSGARRSDEAALAALKKAVMKRGEVELVTEISRTRRAPSNTSNGQNAPVSGDCEC